MNSAITSEQVLNVLKKYWPAKSFAFEYTLHVSLCGSMDVMELVAYDHEHDIYYSTSVTWEGLSTKGFEAAGVAIQDLCDFVKASEVPYVRALL